jgi:hypothetical protein
MARGVGGGSGTTYCKAPPAQAAHKHEAEDNFVPASTSAAKGAGGKIFAGYRRNRSAAAAEREN